MTYDVQDFCVTFLREGAVVFEAAGVLLSVAAVTGVEVDGAPVESLAGAGAGDLVEDATEDIDICGSSILADDNSEAEENERVGVISIGVFGISAPSFALFGVSLVITFASPITS